MNAEQISPIKIEGDVGIKKEEIDENEIFNSSG